MFPLRKASGRGQTAFHSLLVLSFHGAWTIAMTRVLPGSLVRWRFCHSREGCGYPRLGGSERSSPRKGRTAARDPVAVASSRMEDAYDCRLVRSAKNSSS